jgi:hypothetical protein
VHLGAAEDVALDAFYGAQIYDDAAVNLRVGTGRVAPQPPDAQLTN